MNLFVRGQIFEIGNGILAIYHLEVEEILHFIAIILSAVVTGEMEEIESLVRADARETWGLVGHDQARSIREEVQVPDPLNKNKT